MKQFKKKACLAAAMVLSCVMLLTGCGQDDTTSSTELLAVGQATVQGDVQSIRDDTYARGNDSTTGYYRTVPNEKDGSEIIHYVDFATGQEIALCSQLNCRHNNASCAAWIPTSQARNIVVPVGNKLVLLRGGNPNFAEILGDDSLAQVEIMNLDGTDRQVIHQFSAVEHVPGMPRGGFARDGQNLYFMIDSVAGGPRTLYAANVETNQVTALYEMNEEDARIVGGTNSEIILEYTPGAYDISIKGSDLITTVIRFNPETKAVTPLFEHSYLDAGICVNGKYFLLQSDGMIRTYDLQTGALLQEKPVHLADNFEWNTRRSMGFYDGNLMVCGENNFLPEEVTEDHRPFFYYGINPETGSVTSVDWTYKDYFGENQPIQIVAETDRNFLVQSGIESKSITLPDLEGKMYGNRTDIEQYGLISKEDFWNGTGEITPVINTTK